MTSFALPQAWRTLTLLRWWSIRGWFRRTLRLTRNPRYAAGLLAAIAYFFWFVGRPMLGNGGIRALNMGVSVSEGLHLAVAAAIGVYVAVAWLLSRPQPTLKLKSADFHLLMPAPIPRRTLLSYALLQQIPKLLLVALILGLVMTTTGSPWERLRHTGTLMLFFVCWDMFAKSRGILKFRLWQVSPALHWLSQLTAAALALGVLAAMRRGILRFMEAAAAGDLGDRGFWTRMSTDLPQAVLDSPFAWTLKPFTFLTAARLSEDPGTAALSLAAGLALTVLLFLSLVWADPGFNESQVVSGGSRSSRREERLHRHSPRMRRSQPFALTPVGSPATAIWWKHLFSTTRWSLRWILLAYAAAVAILIGVVIATGANRTVTGLLMGSTLIIGCMLPFFSGISGSSGFVKDLKHLEAVRTWPVAPRAMALGQALHSAVIGFGGAVLLFLVALATHITVQALGVTGSTDPLPNEFLAGFGIHPSAAFALVLLSALPGLAGMALLSSQLEGVTGLFLPGWLMMGERRRGDPAAFGTRIIYGIAFFFALALAVLPTGLMVVGLALLAHGGWTPSIWLYPALGLILALPLLAEAVALTYLGGRLWRSLDPSQEVLEGFE